MELWCGEEVYKKQSRVKEAPKVWSPDLARRREKESGALNEKKRKLCVRNRVGQFGVCVRGEVVCGKASASGEEARERL